MNRSSSVACVDDLKESEVAELYRLAVVGKSFEDAMREVPVGKRVGLTWLARWMTARSKIGDITLAEELSADARRSRAALSSAFREREIPSCPSMETVSAVSASGEPNPIETLLKVVDDIRAEASAREPVPEMSAVKDSHRGTALALSGRLGRIERMARAALSVRSRE